MRHMGFSFLNGSKQCEPKVPEAIAEWAAQHVHLILGFESDLFQRDLIAGVEVVGVRHMPSRKEC